MRGVIRATATLLLVAVACRAKTDDASDASSPADAMPLDATASNAGDASDGSQTCALVGNSCQPVSCSCCDRRGYRLRIAEKCVEPTPTVLACKGVAGGCADNGAVGCVATTVDGGRVAFETPSSYPAADLPGYEPCSPAENAVVLSRRCP